MPQRVRMPILFCSLLALVGLSAFAIAQEGDVASAEKRPVPTVRYVMASPRACLIGPPVWCDAASPHCWPMGDADNFPRHGGSIRIPMGGKIDFSLSRQTEGVWYTGSYGLLGTVLELQWCPCCKLAADGCITCDENDRPSADNMATKPVDDASLRPLHWITIGKDGARDVRRGPSIGTAKVGVTVRFLRPGIYHMRGIVTTFASSYHPHMAEIAPRPEAVDEDVVYVTVHVLPVLEPGEQAGNTDSMDPDDAGKAAMPNSLDGEPRTVEAEIDGDDIVAWTDDG